MSKPKFEIGDQIIYVPGHAKGDVCHRDCEEGFVTGYSGDPKLVFCRFFYRDGNLRTRANSEACRKEDLCHNYRSPRPRQDIDKLMQELGYPSIYAGETVIEPSLTRETEEES